MKTILKGMFIATGLTLGAANLPAAPGAGDWIEQHLKAKIGRYSPAEEARLEAERANTAYREETPLKVVEPNWIEQHLKGKLGRYSPWEEARLREVVGSTAFREEASANIATPNWMERHIKVKHGK